MNGEGKATLQAGAQKACNQAENACSKEDFGIGRMLLHHEVNEASQHQDQGQGCNRQSESGVEKLPLQLPVAQAKRDCR